MVHVDSNGALCSLSLCAASNLRKVVFDLLGLSRGQRGERLVFFPLEPARRAGCDGGRQDGCRPMRASGKGERLPSG